MANNLKHKTATLAGGDQLPRIDWEGIDTHEADGQTLGDVLYYDGTYWIRKPLCEVPLTAAWDMGNFQIRALQFYADAAIGTPPLVIISTTIVANLNADQVDSQHRVLTINADHTHQSTGAQGGQLDHGLALTGLADDDHPQYIKHSLAMAINDFLVASGAGAFVKKTLAEVVTLLRTSLDSVYSALGHTHSYAAASHASQHAVGGGDTIFPADPNADKYLMWDDSEGVLVWADAGGGSVATDVIFDAKGDLPVGTGPDTAAKLTVGSNEQRPEAASGETTGIKWSWNSKMRDADGDTIVQTEEGADDDHFRVDVAGVESLLIHEQGIVTLAKQSYVFAYNVTTQSIPSGVWGPQVLFDTEITDVQSEFDSSVKTGTATATTANHLVDTTANQFVAGDVGRFVWNTTDNTYAKITTFNSVSDVTLDTNIMANGEEYKLFFSRFTAKESGVYIVNAGVCMNIGVDGKIIILGLNKNDATGVGGGWSCASSTGSQHKCFLTSIVNLVAGDYLNVRIYHDAGSTKTFYAASDNQFLQIVKVA
jgi:hypothetical protein